MNEFFKKDEILFKVSSKERENRALWRMFQTPFFWALCNTWFRWFAINIPINLLENKLGIQGDLDLIVNIPINPSKSFDDYYQRVFEIKVSSIDIDNIGKSLRLYKVNKIFGQLKKIKNFGCQRVILLELLIIESGYNQKYFSLPEEVMRVLVSSKYNKLRSEGFGYVIQPLEFYKNINEKRTGINHQTRNILPSKEFNTSTSFRKLINFVDDFFKKNQPKSNPDIGFPVISYCKKCKKLVYIYMYQDFICPECGVQMYVL